jgi:ectoine hydroxylase-related dioxygenase (phytanoyl-CoA dioxygenase family)
VQEFGEDKLKEINELNLVRCPLAYNDFFLKLCTKPAIIDLIKHLLGNYFIINQQNGIVNFPNEEHHQSSWHRDLPYQNYVISQPIAVACLLCIDDFNESTGSTFVLPHSHNLEKIPSVNFINKHKVSTNVKKGGAIIFNAMLFHKAGNNTSNIIRRGLNTLYSIPLLKQQVNLHSQLKGRHQEDEWLRKILGYESQVPDTIEQWRENRLKRLKK